MNFQWFNAQEAIDLGIKLADQFAFRLTTDSSVPTRKMLAKETKAQQELFRNADRDVLTLRLNIYKRAKFANSFKWRLIERGISAELSDKTTQSLVLHLSLHGTEARPNGNSAVKTKDRASSADAEGLFVQGNTHFKQGAFVEAIAFYEESIAIRPNHANSQNNLGSALSKVGRYQEAEHYFRQAIDIDPNNIDALSNLGTIQLWMGQISEAEMLLRRALKLKPTHVDARNNLGEALVFLGRSRDARTRFQKVLKASPRHADAMFGMGQVARMEGRFEEAEATFIRALQFKPKMARAVAAIPSVRKMTLSDSAWVKNAEEIAASGIPPLEEADVRFAIGKYWDDVQDFARAFESYKRANEIQKRVAINYDRKARTSFVDDLAGAYTRKTFSSAEGFSDSTKPIFVVGMMRSGTSLVEQIIASHPSATGAGELGYWSDVMRQNENVIRQGLLDKSTRKNLAEGYLRTLEEHSDGAMHVVDKAPINSDYLGVIHSVFPNARIIYMRRDPIDTCLSCYFQHFSPAHNFAMSLSDLAHYYREHTRLVAHWRAVLPPESMMDVPYEELVADQEKWTRKILEFLGLTWDARCLNFHETKRQVATASYWQVRQKIFRSSVGRWRNYEKFVEPLRSLTAPNP
jgi:tetratricopeptide (TPR) repeat protein